MNFELYKPYKTRGGWKAVVVDILGFGTDRFLRVYHEKGQSIYDHNMSGADMRDAQYDLISEWHEPIKRTLYIALATVQSQDKIWIAQSISEAERLAKMFSGEFIQLDYVQGATHYVAKGG